MIVILLIGIISILVLYYVLGDKHVRRMKRITYDIPGPKEYPFVGSALAFGRTGIELLNNIQKLVADFGPVIRVWVGPTLYVVLADAKDIEVILNSTVHLNKPQVYNFLEKWLGTGLVSAPATKWKTQRRVLTPAFHFKILESYIDIFNANSKVMIDLLGKKVKEERIDITTYIDKCTLDIICETAMATRIHAQLNEESQFTKSLKVVSTAVLVRAFKPWLFPNVFFNLSPLGRQFNKNLDYINSYVDKVIAQKKEALSRSRDNSSSPSDVLETDGDCYGKKKRYVFLDLLLMYASDSSTQLSDAEIRDEVNTFMFAGHDTTASTLSFAVYLLASHPDIQEKVVDELKTTFGNSDRDPTYEELLNLKYMDLIIKETLRLYPAVPYIGRKLFEDVKLPSGYTLPAGAAVTLLFFNLHRDPLVFPDPEKFNPDNFLPEKVTGRYAFSYTPFSAGPRNCIGKRFAMLEMKAVLSRLLRTYKITKMFPEPVLASELILRSDTGINVHLEKRIQT